MTAIKICGITDLPNGLAAIDLGAEFLGFVFYGPSPRAIEPDQAARLVAALRDARPTGWRAVGVFVNEEREVVEETRLKCGLDVVQLNGDETPADVAALTGPVFKAVRVKGEASDLLDLAATFEVERMLVDANVEGRYGGTGKTYDWTRVKAAVADGFLAGGLTHDNVASAIGAARPWGVDVSSGVELNGVKSPALMRRFVEAVRSASLPPSPTLTLQGGGDQSLPRDRGSANSLPLKGGGGQSLPRDEVDS